LYSNLLPAAFSGQDSPATAFPKEQEKEGAGRHRHARRTAFPLIELLVVITISDLPVPMLPWRKKPGPRRALLPLGTGPISIRRTP